MMEFCFLTCGRQSRTLAAAGTTAAPLLRDIPSSEVSQSVFSWGFVPVLFLHEMLTVSSLYIKCSLLNSLTPEGTKSRKPQGDTQ